MKKIAIVAFASVLSAGAAFPQTPPSQPPQKFPLLTYLVRGQEGVQRNLVEAAERMPEEHYGVKATGETKPFGQIVAHIALSRFGSCAAMSGKENPHKGDKEETARGKAQLGALLQEAATFCAAARQGLTEESLTQFVSVGVNKNEVARAVFLAGDIAHANEVYGTLAVYLRLKGLVPPSTARANRPRSSQ